MRVYTATKADFERLQDLYFAESSRQAAAAGDYYVAAYQDVALFAGIVELAEGDVLVAEDDGRPVGMAIVSVVARPLSPNISERKYVRLSSLISESDEARDLLIAEAELWATARGIDHLQVSLHAQDRCAEELYTSLGFAPETTLFSRAIARESSPIGLTRGTVKLFPHTAEWEREGARTVDELRGLLGGIAIDAAHVGSTSIPTIPAKPIIDVAIAVYDFDSVLARREILLKHGYHLVPSASGESQLLFAKGGYYEGTSDLQTHFIHVVRVNSREWFDYLNFRSYLIEYREIAAKYAELKLRLARDHSADRESYTAAKGDFIREVLLKASLYYGR